jgi:hypothetical protein
VPTAYAACPREIVRPRRARTKRVYDIRRWTPMPAGGYFAALKEPEALTIDLQLLSRELR